MSGSARLGHASPAVAAFLRAEARRVRAPVALAIMLAVASSATGVANAWLIAGLLDAALAGAAPGAGGAVLAVALLIVLRLALGYGAEQAGFRAGARLRATLREAVLARLLALGPAHAAGTESGATATLLVERIEALEGFVARWLPAAAAAATVPVLFLAVVAPFSLGHALVLLGFGLLVPAGLALVGIGAAQASRRQFRVLARLGGLFLDRLRGLGTLIQYGRVEAEAADMAAAAEDFRRRTMAVLRLAFLSSALLELCAMGALAASALVLVPAIAGGTLARGQGLFLLLLVPEFFQPLRAFAATYHDRAAATGAAEALAPLLAGARAAEAEAAAPDGVPDPAALAVVFEDVRLAHAGGARRALKGLSFAVAPGEAVALVGPSGAGKTTVLDILMGFRRPDAGRVLVGGVPVEHIPPACLRALGAWVGQRTHLFHGSLRENIRFARPEATDAEVERAAEQAQLGAFIATLPQGLDTLVGERGFGLSGGQAQRVAIARAFLKDAPLLLLDEPTAHLDPDTEAALLAVLRRLAQGRTVLMASHSAAAMAALGRRIAIVEGRAAGEDAPVPVLPRQEAAS